MKLYLTLSLVFILTISNIKLIGAQATPTPTPPVQCCVLRTGECTGGLVCTPAAIAGYPHDCDDLNNKPGFCRHPSSTNPDFRIPRESEVPVLQSFKFNMVGTTNSAAGIFNALIPYIFALAGLLLFLYLIYGAFTILSAMGEAAKVASGSKIITRALIGFAILFVSYWIMELLEMVLGLNVI